MFYVVVRAFVQEPFLPMNYNHNVDQIVVYTTPLLGPSFSNSIPTNAKEIDTLKPKLGLRVFSWTIDEE